MISSKHQKLLELVDAHDVARRELQASSLAVWEALVIAEPELAYESLSLFLTPDRAARWAANANASGKSPARQAAEGGASAVLETLIRTSHGFVG